MNKAEYQENKFIEYGNSLITKSGLDAQTIDLKAIYDNKLTWEENKRGLIDFIRIAIQDNTIDEEQVNEQRRDWMENNKIEEPKPDVNDIYKPLYQAVEKVVQGYSNFLMVRSKAGLGKSFNIKNALKTYNADYVVIKDTTLAYLPELLYAYNGKTLWFQDCAYKFLRGIDSIEILKSITETNPEDRIVNNYNYNPAKEQIPKEFIFTGRIIMDYNRVVDLKYMENYQALLSRADVIELVFSKAEVSQLMRTIAKTDEQKAITEFLIENFNELGQDSFNLRTQANAFKDYEYCKDHKIDWKEYILTKIQNNRSQIFVTLYQFLGKEAKKVTELKKWLIRNQNFTIRTADRRISEYIELGELINLEPMRERDYMVSLFQKGGIL